MIKEAMRSISDDFLRAFFYWLTFVLTSMFMFLFFHLSLSQVVGVSFINGENSLSTFITVFVIGICMIVIFFANNFYVKKKSKDLGVRLVCGANYLQIASYLLIQTLLLFVTAIPLGIVIGIVLIPIMNQGLFLICGIRNIIVLSLDALISTSIIVLVEIFWCTLVNLGFTYRSSILSLMSENDRKISVKLPFSFFKKGNTRTKKRLSLLCFIVPIILFYIFGKEESNLVMVSFIGIISLSFLLKHFIISSIHDSIMNKYSDDPIKMAYLGFLRNDLLSVKMSIILLFTSAIVFLMILVVSLESPIDMMLAVLSYVVMNVLLILSLMFQLSTLLAERGKTFLSLEKIGFTKELQQKIMNKEMIAFYGIVGICCLYYIVNILIVLVLYHGFQLDFVFMMVLSFLIPLIICAMINMIYYRKNALRED